MSKAKSAHYSKIIAEYFCDYGTLWKAFNKILHRCPKMHFPDHSSIVALAKSCSSFFINKIPVIWSSFPSDSHSRVLNPPDTWKVLQNLTCVTTDEVCRPVLLASCKSSELDPMPTSLTSIINLSLTEGSFPSHLKSAHVSPPPLTKPSLNKDSMNNYRPVSNLSFLSKVPRCSRHMSKAKSAHYCKTKAFNTILHRCPKMQLPDHFSLLL